MESSDFLNTFDLRITLRMSQITTLCKQPTDLHPSCSDVTDSQIGNGLFVSEKLFSPKVEGRWAAGSTHLLGAKFSAQSYCRACRVNWSCSLPGALWTKQVLILTSKCFPSTFCAAVMTRSDFKARNSPTCSGWGGSRAGINQRLQCIMVTITKKIQLINSPPKMGLICNSVRVCQPTFTNLYWLVFAYFQKLFQLLSRITISHLQHFSDARVLRREGLQGFVCFLKLSM